MMALIEYRCKCGYSTYIFPDESWRDWTKCKRNGERADEYHFFTKQPPRVSVVLATNMVMLGDPQLDSLHTIYELDRQLNIETRAQKETEIFQEIRRNL